MSSYTHRRGPTELLLCYTYKNYEQHIIVVCIYRVVYSHVVVL